MDLIDNVNHRLGDDLKAELVAGRRLQVAASRFSIYAFDALREALARCDGLDFLFTQPTFLPGTATDATTPEVRRYRLQRPPASLTATYEIRLRNRLSQRAVARDCAAWLREGRTNEDLLFQVLLDWGVDLGLPITPEDVSGHRTFFVDTDALAACFETDLDEAYVKALAARKPLRVVFRDGAFGDDAGQINVVQLFRQLSPDTDVRVL